MKKMEVEISRVVRKQQSRKEPSKQEGAIKAGRK
jgi:hypothetical protein